MSLQRGLAVLLAGLSIVTGGQGVSTAFAQGGHEGHAGTGHESMGHGGQGAAAAPALPQGVVIRESKVQGYEFVYRLYSWDERNAMMKGMEGHAMPGMDSTGKSTNHLMVFIKGADGKFLSGAQVGFIVAGPDQTAFKTLTMGMYDGYGADIPLKTKGAHQIKTKAVIGDKTLTEEFSHTVK